MSGVKLVRYDAAKRALAAAVAVDEVKRIRNEAAAMKAYARQADDQSMVHNAEALIERATRQVGLLMRKQAAAIGKAKPPSGKGQRKTDRRVGTRPDGPPTLREAGIGKHLADRARKLAKLSDDEFEDAVERGRDQGDFEELNTLLANVSTKPRVAKPKPDPHYLDWQSFTAAVQTLADSGPFDLDRLAKTARRVGFLSLNIEAADRAATRLAMWRGALREEGDV
jgi:hypothetical protein